MTCIHVGAIPVHAYPTDELVAHLCPDCDAQLPVEWKPLRPSILVPADPLVGPSPYVGPEFGSGIVARPNLYLALAAVSNAKMVAYAITAGHIAAAPAPSPRRHAWWRRSNEASGSK